MCCAGTRKHDVTLKLGAHVLHKTSNSDSGKRNFFYRIKFRQVSAFCWPWYQKNSHKEKAKKVECTLSLGLVAGHCDYRANETDTLNQPQQSNQHWNLLGSVEFLQAWYKYSIYNFLKASFFALSQRTKKSHQKSAKRSCFIAIKTFEIGVVCFEVSQFANSIDTSTDSPFEKKEACQYPLITLV